MAAIDVGMLTRELIGGMDMDLFDRDVREKRVEKFECAIPREQLAPLFSLSKLEALLKMDAIPVLYVDLFDGGNLRRLVDVQSKTGKSNLAVIAESLRRGATLRVREIDKFDAELRRFAQEIRRQFAAQAQMNVYLTPASKAGFAPHFDTTDVFVLQCLGEKEWRIYPEYTNKIELPPMDTPWDPDRFRPSAGAMNFTLRAGDVLYIPRGEMHEAFCTERESMHLTIGSGPLTFADLLAKALKLAAETDIRFRLRVPWSVNAQTGEAQISVEANRLASELARRIDVHGLLSAERDSLCGAAESAASVNLESAIRSAVETLSR